MKSDHMATLNLQLMDIPVTLTGLPAPVRARLADLLAPFVARPSASGSASVRIRIAPWADGSGWDVMPAGGVTRGFGDEDLLLRHVEWLVASRAMEATGAYAVFHGAALVRGDDATLLLAKSGSGKTTLTLGLMQRGWLPLTDDIVVVDRETLGIYPFPRCFHLDDSVRARMRDRAIFAWPGRLAGYARPARWAEDGHTPTSIILVRRCATCPSARVPVMRAEAAGALLDQSIASALGASGVARVAVRLAASARACYRLTNGHLDGALNLIESAASAIYP